MHQEKQLPPFYLIGLPLKVTLDEAPKTIGPHWDRFFEENCLEKIPNKLNDTLYGLYTDYEGDFTKPYTLVVGVEVSSLSSIPEGMVGKEIPAQTYIPFETEGELPQALVDKWVEIWKTPLNRTYSADFEKFDGGALTIYIGVK